jgi:peptidoglycan/LPS O-acetylase OafA/YrhL
MGDEIFYKYTGYYGGDLAIKGFFFISGVLVSSSLIASASPIKYMMARIFRIFPALIVVATLCTYVIGPLVTTKHLGEYLANHETWRYMWRTATLQIWGGQGLGYFNLPGVFTENPYKDTVNAPLWSVGAEFYCYLLLLAVYICTKLDKKIALTLFLLIVVGSMLPEKIIFFWLQQASPDFSLLPFCFAFGTIFAIYQREIQVKTSVLIGALFVGYLLRGGSFAHMFGYVVFFVGILVFSTSRLALKIRLPHDVSYGVYLWGWPIQQLFAHFFPGAPHIVAIVACISAAILTGYVSCIWIEEPALRIGRSLARRLTSRSPARQNSQSETLTASSLRRDATNG